MRAMLSRTGSVLMVLGACLAPQAAWPADPEVSITVVPMRHVTVDGDEGKFRAHHWMREGYAAGIKDASLHHALANGAVFSAEGHALIDQNDLGAEFSLKKEGLGFVDFDYEEFRKYYDDTGGGCRLCTIQSSDTFRDLALDIGKLGLKTGMTMEDLPEVTFEYEREFKDGAKSRLTWAAVKPPSRKIAPAWQEIEEIADTFALEVADELAGFDLKGEQRWEFVRSEVFREEKNLATTGIVSDTQVLRQDQAPESTLLTTLLSGERHFLSDKVFFTGAYRFAHMNNREFENILERRADDTPGGTHNRYNARADNDYDTHTWAEHVSFAPVSWLSVGAQLKTEVVKRASNSTYPADTTNPADGIVNTTEQSLNTNKASRWGEGLSLRFTGIPRAALYTELELEQSRVLMREDRRSLAGQSGSNAGETFNRETVTSIRRGAGTLGGRINPWPFLDLTAHARRRVNNNDYDDQRESVAAGGALSAFTDEQNIHTNEFVTRATLKPCRWFRTSTRYQFRDDDYSTRFEAQDHVKADMTSHKYTFDVMLQPLKDLTTTASFSRQTASTTTPAAFMKSSPAGLQAHNVPTFNADVNMWILGTDYALQSNVTLTSNFTYTWADNFDDFTDRGQPFGADFQKVDLVTGATWSPTSLEDTTFGVEYDLYTHDSNANVEPGDYTAHVFWIEATQKF